MKFNNYWKCLFFLGMHACNFGHKHLPALAIYLCLEMRFCLLQVIPNLNWRHLAHFSCLVLYRCIVTFQNHPILIWFFCLFQLFSSSIYACPRYMFSTILFNVAFSSFVFCPILSDTSINSATNYVNVHFQL